MRTVAMVILLYGLADSAAFAAPDIEVLKSTNNSFPSSGEPVEFTVQATNIGDELATDVLVVEQLPAELVIPDGTAAFAGTGSYDPASGEWFIGDLEPGASAVLVVPALVSEPAPPDCIVNSARSEFPDEPNDSNNEARAAIHQTGVEHCADIDVDFGISASSVAGFFPECDSMDRYEGNVHVINHGPDSARNVVVTMMQSPVVGPNLRFDDAACNNGSSSTCEIGEIAAGETVTITVTSDLYQSYSSFTQTLSVDAVTTDSDYDASNNSPSVTGTGGGFSNCDEPDFGLKNVGVPPACFIATAAYGSAMHPRIDSLRGFRDRYMINNALGRAIVRFYYRHSPPLADYIAERDWLRAIVRGLLAPIVYIIEYPAQALLLLVGLVAARVVRRQRRSRRLA